MGKVRVVQEQVSPDEMPEPHPAITLNRSTVEALTVWMLSRFGKKAAREFLEILDAIAENEETLARTFPLKGSARDAKVRRARQEAASLHAAARAVYWARIPPT